MRIAIFILRAVMSFVYFFMKLIPTDRRKVVFISRQSNIPGEDFRALEAELKRRRPDIKIVFVTQRIDRSVKSVCAFAWATLRSMYHLATSRVCVLDAFWPAASMLRHKPELAVIQLWHAMGKIKQSGYQALGKEYGRGAVIARAMKMHEGYDVVIAGGRAFDPFYCASFGVKQDVLYNVGLPRMDLLREGTVDARRRFFRTYPELEGKKLVLYAPTFRKHEVLDPTELIRAFGDRDDSVLIIKRHPNQRLSLSDVSPAMTCDRVPTSTVLSVCDCVITDYSAITIEAALLNKPVYFYLFDYEEYLSRNGLNVKLFEEFPDNTFVGAKELIDCIDSAEYDFDNYERFRKKYLPDLSGRATDKISDLIIGCMETDKHDAICARLSEQNKAGSAVDNEDTVRA